MGSCQAITVAIIDDDESVCRSLGRLLRAAGMESVAYSSAEALLADDGRPRLDCLVLDVQLPGISGIELRAQLAASGDRTPVIFITAYDEPGIREQALATGCAAYFRKTDPGEAVLAAIRQAVGIPAQSLNGHQHERRPKDDLTRFPSPIRSTLANQEHQQTER